MPSIAIQCNAEQQAAVDAAVAGKNVVVVALPGCGKTSLITALEQRVPDDMMLVIMYSKALKGDTKRKLLGGGKGNARAHTVHGFYTGYYDHLSRDEGTLRDVIRLNKPPLKGRRFAWKYIVIDESQDVTPLLYEALVKIIADNDHPNPVIIVLGDERQTIFSYAGADPRYLTRAEILYRRFSTRPWVHVVLNETYRFHVPLCHFLNKTILKGDFFKSATLEGPKPIVVRGDPFTAVQKLAKDKYISIRTETNRDPAAHRAKNILVLTPSVKSKTGCNTPARTLGNWFNSCKVPIYYPTEDEECPKVEALDDKVTFSTFHKAKGMERDLVIVYNADESWYSYYGSGESRDAAPCCWIVALTRARIQLVIVQDYKEKPLPFAAWDVAPDTFRFVDYPTESAETETEDGPVEVPDPMVGPPAPRVVNVRELLAHQPWFDMNSAQKELVIEKLTKEKGIDDIETVVPGVLGRKTKEDVSDIIGRAVSLWTCYRKMGRVIWEPPTGMQEEDSVLDGEQITEMRLLINSTSKRIDDMFRLAALVYSFEERLRRRLAQVPEGVRILGEREEEINAAIDGLAGCRRFNVSIAEEAFGVKLACRLDAIDEQSRGWIIKFTTSTTPEQLLQAGITDYLRRRKDGDDVPGTLLINLRTGDRYSVKVKRGFAAALGRLVVNKLRRGLTSRTDKEFHAEVDPIIEKWAERAEENRRVAGWDMEHDPDVVKDDEGAATASAQTPTQARVSQPRTSLITRFFKKRTE